MSAALKQAKAKGANDERKPANASTPKKLKAKVEGQREMLLPIAGGKPTGRSEAGENFHDAAEGRGE